MVAIIDRQQFETERKVVYVDNVNKLSSFVFATPGGFSLSCVISPFTLKYVRGQSRPPITRRTNDGQNDIFINSY